MRRFKKKKISQSCSWGKESILNFTGRLTLFISPVQIQIFDNITYWWGHGEIHTFTTANGNAKLFSTQEKSLHLARKVPKELTLWLSSLTSYNWSQIYMNTNKKWDLCRKYFFQKQKLRNNPNDHQQQSSWIFLVPSTNWDIHSWLWKD